MRRPLPSILVVLLGGLLLADYVVVNPSLAAVSAALLELIVLLAAAAALAGAVALAMRHWGPLTSILPASPGGADEARRAEGGPDRSAAVATLIGLGFMLAAGFYPGSRGATDPVVGWLVAALLAPLVASLFGLLFFHLLRAARRSMSLRTREASIMLSAAAIVIVLLLPLGGAVGDWLAAAAGWTLTVPVGGVFRGLLIGIAILTAVQATRILLAVESHE
jgi:hypothetical protein